MNFKLKALAAALLVASAGAASANVSMVNCQGFSLSIADDVVVAGQERAGSARQFEISACERAQQLPLDKYTGPTRVKIALPALDMETVVVVFPLDKED